jgi:hypothetical protein
MLLRMQVITIINDDEQTWITHRRKHGRPGSHHYPGLPPQDAEPMAIALGGTQISGEPGNTVSRQCGFKNVSEVVNISMVGHHHQNRPTVVMHGAITRSNNGLCNQFGNRQTRWCSNHRTRWQALRKFAKELLAVS